MLKGSHVITFDKFTKYQIPNVKAKMRLKRPHQSPLLQVKWMGKMPFKIVSALRIPEKLLPGDRWLQCPIYCHF